MIGYRKAPAAKTPNEIALDDLLAGFTLCYYRNSSPWKPFVDHSQNTDQYCRLHFIVRLFDSETIGAGCCRLSVAGMDRALRANVITKSGKAERREMWMLLLDKTGTITIGNRKATNFLPAHGVEEDHFIRSVALSPGRNPEGKLILELAGGYAKFPTHNYPRFTNSPPKQEVRELMDGQHPQGRGRCHTSCICEN